MANGQNENNGPLPFVKRIKEVEVDIALLCSDSRNTPGAYYKEKEKILQKLLKKGVFAEIKRINDPGTFMTVASIGKIMKMILKREALYSEFAKHGEPPTYNIHVISHGNVHRKKEYSENKLKTYYWHQLDQDEHCCTHCGMTHAEVAIKAFQDFLVSSNAKFTFEGKEVAINSHESLRAYMKWHFKGHGAPENWDGDLLNWLEPISDVRTHPVKELAKLDAALKADPRFKDILPRIKLFGEVTNYTNRGLYRVDGKPEQIDRVFRFIYKRIRRNGKTEDHDKSIAPQPSLNPPLIISNTVPNVRQIAAEALGRKPSAGEGFSIVVDTDKGHFGPLSAVGVFYDLSPAFLNKNSNGRVVLVHRSDEEKKALLEKIEKDNLVRHTIEKLRNPNEEILHVRSTVDSRQHFPHPNPNKAGSAHQRRHARR